MARVIYVCMNELLSGTQTVDYRAGGRSENLRGGGQQLFGGHNLFSLGEKN